MNHTLPYAVDIDGVPFAIRNKCDYRVVLDVIDALQDEELPVENRLECALFIFYEESSKITDVATAAVGMMNVVNMGDKTKGKDKPPLMDWEHDFDELITAVNDVLGYDAREPDKFTHWWTFIGAYKEIKESTFRTILHIRNKRQKGEKLDDWERKFMRDNPDLVMLPIKLTEDDRAFLEYDM